MVYEIAKISVIEGKEEQFEEAVLVASQFFKEAEGCISLHLERCIEESNHYRLVVGWETVEAHTVTFKSSKGFQKWRELASPFFKETPVVEHVECVLTAF